MKGFKSKRGISLIVLVITIIVMIILAAAIILSISNSGIMNNANKAKRDSDSANITEYVNVLEAEWELMDTEERQNSDYTSKEEYVNGKLEDKGYTGALLMEDGTLYTNLQANAKAALKAGIQIGHKVNYTIETVKKYTPKNEMTGSPDNTELETKTNLTWVYIGVSDNGELLISPDVSSETTVNSNVTLYGKTGWLNGSNELNTVCDMLYTVDGKGKARNMNIDDVNRLLGYTGEKGSYNDYEFVYQPTSLAFTVAELEKKFGELTHRKTPIKPDGVNSNLGEYKSDYYDIDKTAEDDVKVMNYPENIKYVYPVSFDYWLASSCVRTNFSVDAKCVIFRVRYVKYDRVVAYDLFVSDGTEKGYAYSIRPVVSVTSYIQKIVGEDNSIVWNFDLN